MSFHTIMYTLKQLPQDFIVTELNTSLQLKPSGRYTYFKLTKTNRNTLDVIQELSRIFHIPEKQIGFAGTKDKNAITTQLCSIPNISPERINGLHLPNVTIEFLGYGNEPITLGSLDGNRFDITIRNLTNEKITPQQFIPNYFDEQRFSKHNVQIGKHLLKKEFKQAIELIDDEKCIHHLDDKQNDYVGALKKIPIRLLRLYLNAYQSKLWNEIVAEYLKLHGKSNHESTYSQGTLQFPLNIADFQHLTIPIIGFTGIPPDTTPEIRKIIETVMKQENLTVNDFIIKQIPELTLEGELRKVTLEIKDLTISPLEDDELNQNKKKIKVSFSLGKGSYATMVIKSLFIEQAQPSAK